MPSSEYEPAEPNDQSTLRVVLIASAAAAIIAAGAFAVVKHRTDAAASGDEVVVAPHRIDAAAGQVDPDAANATTDTTDTDTTDTDDVESAPVPVDELGPTAAKLLTTVMRHDALALTWEPSVDLPIPGAVGVAGYIVMVDDRVEGLVGPDATQTIVVTTPRTDGEPHKVQIVAVDHNGTHGAVSTAQVRRGVEPGATSPVADQPPVAGQSPVS